MKKIAIVCDSSVAFTDEQIKKYDVDVIPNLIIHKDKSYRDQIDINQEEIIKLLNNKEKITSSQANLGTIVEKLEDIKLKNYDYIFILTLGSVLSGAFNSFSLAAEQAKLENYSIIDTHSIAGPVQEGVRAIRSMNKSGASIQAIEKHLHYLFSDQVSYLFPKSLDQIVASGRVSKAGAKLVSLLKIKPIVYFYPKSKSIEKLGIARTDTRAFQTIVKHFNKHHVTPEKYNLYILEIDALEEANKFKDHLFKTLGEFNYHHIRLPAVLALHAGVGAITIQWCPKTPQ